SWVIVEVPVGWEVNQISCGPTGLVWTVAWDGSALVRTGINRDNVCGNNWVKVEAPNESKLMQVSVGVDSVWALTRDGKVWFRKGIRGLNSGHNDNCAVGLGWVEMFQEMSLLSVTSNDQTQAWIWISASSCALNSDSYLQFSYASHDSQTSLDISLGSSLGKEQSICSEECEWRSNILMQLNKRYEIEMKDFMSVYQKAIESGVWIKSGTCFVAKSDKTVTNWCPGLLELERQGVERTTESGSLTISYSNSSQKIKVNKKVLNLAEISCAFIGSSENSMYSISNCLVIIANNFIAKIKFQTDTELDDWLATINLVCGDLHTINGTTGIPGARILCVTNKGDLYVGHQLSADNIFYYLLSGGHFNSVTACLGVVWALSYDHVLFVHNNGSGGGVYKD
ncbi:unnamed protein product, partial [Oppiella nova]